MTALTLIIGSRNGSSWSLRAHLTLGLTGQPFEEKLVLLDWPDSAEKIAAAVRRGPDEVLIPPRGRVPVLLDGDRVIWDTLAIAEHLHERFPDAGLWPEDADARALARSVTAEMHSSFAALRTHLPMDLRARRPGVGQDHPGVQQDIRRILQLWNHCRARHGQGGPFLFGRFCLADAFYAPVATRFQTYVVPLDPVSTAYQQALLDLPAVRAWTAAALPEPVAPDHP